jgi:hypothetical protein
MQSVEAALNKASAGNLGRYLRQPDFNPSRFAMTVSQRAPVAF